MEPERRAVLSAPTPLPAGLERTPCGFSRYPAFSGSWKPTLCPACRSGTWLCRGWIPAWSQPSLPAEFLLEQAEAAVFQGRSWCNLPTRFPPHPAKKNERKRESGRRECVTQPSCATPGFGEVSGDAGSTGRGDGSTALRPSVCVGVQGVAALFFVFLEQLFACFMQKPKPKGDLAAVPQPAEARRVHPESDSGVFRVRFWCFQGEFSGRIDIKLRYPCGGRAGTWRSRLRTPPLCEERCSVPGRSRSCRVSSHAWVETV